MGSKMVKTHLLQYCRLWLILPFLLSACAGKEEGQSPIQPEREVRLFLPTDGLGDMAYNDDIMRGVLEAQKEFEFSLQHYAPSGQDEALQKIDEWKAAGSAAHNLTIFSSNEFEELASVIDGKEENHSYLLVEASKSHTIPTLSYSGYGVSFLIGIAAYTYTHADTAIYIGGQKGHAFIEECFIGFRDGYRYLGGEVVEAFYLSDKPDGFSMAHEAYQLADSLYRHYPFIFPVAGGSNSGIYRWLRNHPEESCYTVGVDVDQSVYSNHIIGSMIKEVGRTLYDYIRIWTEGEELPPDNLFGLQSEYISFLLAKAYQDDLQEVIDSYINIAVEKESEYNKGRYE